MNEVSATCNLTTLKATPNAISLPESGDGHTPCALPDGPMTSPSGRVPALVSLSASPENAKALMTSGTFGPSSRASSEPASLQSSLASKLRQKMDGRGSPLYSLTWKTWPIDGQEPICALRASVRRISDSGYTGLVTVSAREWQDWSKASVLAKLRSCGVARHICKTSPSLHSSQDIVGLNPLFGGWQMGYPTSWEACRTKIEKGPCAAMATPSSRNLRRPLSKPTSRP